MPNEKENQGFTPDNPSASAGGFGLFRAPPFAADGFALFLRGHGLPPLVMPPQWRPGETLGLSFSGGKESLAIAAAFRLCGVSFESVFFDLLPGSDLTRDIPTQWADKIGPVTTVTHPRFVEALNSGLFETRESMKRVARESFAEYTFQDGCDDVFPDIEWWAIGIRGADSPMRRMAVRKTGGVVDSKQQFWPLAHWNIADVRRMLDIAAIVLPRDYALFKRSFDGYEARYTAKMSAHDRRLMDALFPHWRADCARRIYARKEIISDGV